jgi:hypothetical protein
VYWQWPPTSQPHGRKILNIGPQVELLKDQLEEAEEQTSLVTKELREKSRDFELLKRHHADAQRAVQLLQVGGWLPEGLS